MIICHLFDLHLHLPPELFEVVFELPCINQIVFADTVALVSRYGQWESRELHHLKLLIFNTESHFVCSSHFLGIMLYSFPDTDYYEHHQENYGDASSN